ncbi:hypothetical protein HK097_010727 [Rhizophlyctis rosea]|uniref:TauD/TfdA-like domain-containing protein n=1 Tax=Rhizophlyctis rosea TaxID=64517 RepID=A0AAD5S9K4_9FUNG|nr:hypothetical protein HK097_010727 [Rhizophlyctis rosea]
MTVSQDYRPPTGEYRSFSQYKAIEYSAYFGTEFEGVDLTQLTDQQIEDLKVILAERGVVFFRGQDNLVEEKHIELGGRLGEHHVHPSWKGPRGPIFVAETRQSWANHWHSDVSFDQETPVKYSILKMEQLPPAGGDTAWASAELAYYKLSPSLRAYLSTLTAEHDSALTFGANSSNPHTGNDFKEEFGKDKPRFPRAIHPVIRTHPITGRQAIFVNRGFTTRIVELTKSESETLLNFLYNLIDRGQEFSVRFRWSLNAVAIWDNTQTQHKAIGDFLPNDRKGFRVSTKSEKPFFDGERKAAYPALYETEGWQRVLDINPY